MIAFLGAADRWVLRIEKMDKDGWTKDERGIQQLESRPCRWPPYTATNEVWIDRNRATNSYQHRRMSTPARYAAADQVYRWCSPPIRLIAHTLLDQDRRDSTKRQAGVSLLSPLCVLSW